MPLIEAHFGEPFFMKYNKQPLSVNNQIAQLQNKGLTFNDLRIAKIKLKNVNFYRLSSYFHPFYQEGSKTFKQSATFESIIKLYEYDRLLRLKLFGCIEQIEIGIRARFVHKYSMQKGTHWHLKSSLFKKYEDFALFQKSLYDVVKANKNKVPFIKHYVSKYSDPEYPVNWMVLELFTFGQISRLYKAMKDDKVKKSIAQDFGITNSVLESWLHSCNYLRNICAHHFRLWNKELKITPKNPRRIKFPFLSDTSSINHSKLFFSLSIILYMLDVINPDCLQKQELQLHIANTNVEFRQMMGFPNNYKKEVLWK